MKDILWTPLLPTPAALLLIYGGNFSMSKKKENFSDMRTAFTLFIAAIFMTLLAVVANAQLYVDSDTGIQIGDDNDTDNSEDSNLIFVVDGGIKIDGEVREGSQVQLSNGETITIMINPQEARQRAQSNMEMDYCDERNECEVELKEERIDGETYVVYEVEAEKPVKIFGFIKTNMEVETTINAETGNVIETSNSWWSFMATSDTNASAGY